MADNNPDYIKKFVDHLGQSLLEDLKESIPEYLGKMVDVRFKGIKDGLEPLGDIASIQREQSNMIENLQLSYDHLSKEVESLRKKNQNLPEQLAQANSDTLDKKTEEMQSAVLDAVSSQLEQIPTKPSKPIKKRRFRLRFWKKGVN